VNNAGEANAPQVNAPVLQIRDLRTYLYTANGVVRAVDGVNIDLHRGETLGLVGESGSGKTMTGLSIMRLLPRSGRIVSGQILLHGEDLARKSDAEMAAIRGRAVSMVLQDPLTALNPVLRIRDQMTETLQTADRMSHRVAGAKALELLTMFRIPDASLKLGAFPHQMSGGMRQRVLSAIAISRGPAVLIADEPTTSLDATLQLDYLRLLKEIQAETGVAIIFITHDFGIVERLCDRVAVMYAGRIVETADTPDLLSAPDHPYTQGLIDSLPDPTAATEFLPTIAGEPPRPEDLPAGCTFHPRCPFAFDRCKIEYPPEFVRPGERMARCWLLADG
jgi:oligopeptide/dipeptide ABC transporter ATP-binding protein